MARRIYGPLSRPRPLALQPGGGAAGPAGSTLIIDIQNRLQGKARPMSEWAKVFNLQSRWRRLWRLTADNGLTGMSSWRKRPERLRAFSRWPEKSKQWRPRFQPMQAQRATVNYAKTRPVFEAYKASRYSKKFLAEHEQILKFTRQRLRQNERHSGQGQSSQNG